MRLPAEAWFMRLAFMQARWRLSGHGALTRGPRNSCCSLGSKVGGLAGKWARNLGAFDAFLIRGAVYHRMTPSDALAGSLLLGLMRPGARSDRLSTAEVVALMRPTGGSVRRQGRTAQRSGGAHGRGNGGVAAGVFHDARAVVHPLFCQPSGRRLNLNCCRCSC